MNLHRWRWKSIHNNQDQAWIENYWLNADPVEVAALIIPLPNQIVRLLRMKSHCRRRLFVIEDKLLEANLLRLKPGNAIFDVINAPILSHFPELWVNVWMEYFSERKGVQDRSFFFARGGFTYHYWKVHVPLFLLSIHGNSCYTDRVACLWLWLITRRLKSRQ